MPELHLAYDHALREMEAESRAYFDAVARLTGPDRKAWDAHEKANRYFDRDHRAAMAALDAFIRDRTQTSRAEADFLDDQRHIAGLPSLDYPEQD